MSNGVGGDGRLMTIQNTFILDDRSDIALHNVENLIQIPPYEPRLSYRTVIKPDHALHDLVEWLMQPEVIRCRDIRTLPKDKIFQRRS